MIEFFQPPRRLSCGVVVVNDAHELLLCHVTGHDHWDLPKGRPEPGESPLQAALRETREECGALARIEGLLGVYSYPGRPVIVAVYRASLLPESPEPYAADETLEVGWFAPEEIDRLDLAFRSSADALSALLGRPVRSPRHEG